MAGVMCPRTELILYLEPHKDSTLAQQVRAFNDQSRTATWAGHANEALKYPVHITMVGFFDEPVDRSIVQDLIQFLDLQLPRWFVTNDSIGNETAAVVSGDVSDPSLVHPDTRSTSSIAVVEGLIRPKPTALLVAIRPSEILLELLQSLHAQFPVLGLRLKKTNHLSLCYWDNDEVNAAPDQEKEQLHALWADQAEVCARRMIPCLTRSTVTGGEVREPNREKRKGMDVDVEPSKDGQMVDDLSWDIVLYSIQGRNRLNGLSYPLKELKRWHL